MDIKYYKSPRYDYFIASDDAGNYYAYEERSWLRMGWIRAKWKRTIDHIKSNISNPKYAKPISQNELKMTNIPLIAPGIIRDEPAYDYRLNEDGDVVALGDMDQRWIFRDGWWEYVHGFIRVDVSKASNALLRGQLLHEGNEPQPGKMPLSQYNAQPLKITNQICQMPNLNLVRFPLQEASMKLKGRYFDFIWAVEKVYPFIKKWHPEHFDNYVKAFETLIAFKNTQNNDFFEPNFKRPIADFAERDETGEIQEAINTIVEIHKATMKNEPAQR